MYELRLRELREEKRITQNEIAKYLTISRSAYAHYESGDRQMNYETLCLLADYYAVSIDYLIGRCETNPIIVTKKETQLIELYRLLDERGKATIELNLNFEYEQSDKKETNRLSYSV